MRYCLLQSGASQRLNPVPMRSTAVKRRLLRGISMVLDYWGDLETKAPESRQPLQEINDREHPVSRLSLRNWQGYIVPAASHRAVASAACAGRLPVMEHRVLCFARLLY